MAFTASPVGTIYKVSRLNPLQCQQQIMNESAIYTVLHYIPQP